MPATDWKSLARARGLELSESEIAKLAAVMDPLELAYESLAANLTPSMEPAPTIGEEAIEVR